MIEFPEKVLAVFVFANHAVGWLLAVGVVAALYATAAAAGWYAGGLTAWAVRRILTPPDPDAPIRLKDGWWYPKATGPAPPPPASGLRSSRVPGRLNRPIAERDFE